MKNEDLLTANLFGHLATLGEDGSVQSTPIWFRYVNGKLEINSAKGRVKDRNMRANPQVALSVVDPKNGYRYIELRGKVVEIEEGPNAERMIDELAKAYMGVDSYPYRTAEEQRVRYVVEIQKTTSM